MVRHVAHPGLHTPLLAHALPNLVSGKPQHQQQHQHHGTQNAPHRLAHADSLFCLVYIHGYHTQHLALAQYGHIGLAVDGRAAGATLTRRVVNHLAVYLPGQQLVADSQLGTVLGSLPNAIGFAGRWQRSGLRQIV